MKTRHLIYILALILLLMSLLSGVSAVESVLPENTETTAVESVENSLTSSDPSVNLPIITKFTNTDNGTKITWTRCEGASKYRVYCLDGNKKWKKLADVSSTSYTHKNLKNGKKYTYTVSCLDADAKLTGAYDENGVSNVFVVSPEITSIKSAYGGVQIKWKKTAAASAYRIYRKSGKSDWKAVGTAEGTSYTDKKVTSGKKYTYTVRCLDAQGSLISSQISGKSVKYIKAPKITKFTNTDNGTKITWTKCEGAKEYGIYYLDGNKKWKKLADVSSTSYTHKNLKNGKKYTYAVRSLDGNGKFLGGYNEKGDSNIFLTSPKINSVKNVSGGVQIKWKKRSAADAYRIYRKSGKSDWKAIGTTEGTSFTDKKATSGKTYTYTVRCLDTQGKLISSLTSGKSIKYVKAPLITDFENTVNGIKISWTKSKGAEKYGVYYLDGNGKWKKLADVRDTEYTHNKLKNGKIYTYRIICLDKKGNSVSGANAGKSNTFIAPPQISEITLCETGVSIKWNAVNGVSGYRLYRKELGSSWKKLADISSGNSYVDATTEADKAYSYTLRCLNADGEFISAYDADTAFYVNGKLADGAIKVGKDTYYFNNGLFRSGLQTINGKKYYYNAKGDLEKGGIVGSKADGWYYANKNGVINTNYVNGVKDKGNYWIVINGEARKVRTKSDKTLYRAAKEVAKCTNTKMTKEEKLRECFDYSKEAYGECRPRTPHYMGDDWPILYANDMFVDGKGNCFSYAAAFAYMAKAIGYEKVYSCSSGGHGWAEVDGLVYDPEWSKHNDKHTYFGLDYDKVKSPDYKGGISAGESWMRVEVR